MEGSLICSFAQGFLFVFSVRHECLCNFSRNKGFAAPISVAVFGFAQFNVFLTGLSSNVPQMKHAVCAAWISFGEEGSTVTQFTVYVQISAWTVQLILLGRS